MTESDEIYVFAQHRLRGESLPVDLKIIYENRVALQERCGMTLSADPDWEPWSDTSYLTEADLANPGIAANVQAISGVVNHISFVAATEEGEYLGYWRSLAGRSIAESPIACLDNEGQFNLCIGSSLADAIIGLEAYSDDEFTEWKNWFESLGIHVPYTSIEMMPVPDDKPTPKEIHNRLYDDLISK